MPALWGLGPSPVGRKLVASKEALDIPLTNFRPNFSSSFKDQRSNQRALCLICLHWPRICFSPKFAKCKGKQPNSHRNNNYQSLADQQKHLSLPFTGPILLPSKSPPKKKKVYFQAKMDTTDPRVRRISPKNSSKSSTGSCLRAPWRPRSAPCGLCAPGRPRSTSARGPGRPGLGGGGGRHRTGRCGSCFFLRAFTCWGH